MAEFSALGPRFRGDERRLVQWRCKPKFIRRALWSRKLAGYSGRQNGPDKNLMQAAGYGTLSLSGHEAELGSGRFVE